MRKIIIIFAIMLVISLAVSCSNDNLNKSDSNETANAPPNSSSFDDSNVPDSSSITNTPPNSSSINDTNVPDYIRRKYVTSLYGELAKNTPGELLNIYHNPIIFATNEKQDASAPMQIQLNIFGDEYTLDYITTGTATLMDSNMHHYSLVLDSMGNQISILVDTNSGEIVKYVGVPYHKVTTGEQGYLDLIFSIIDQDINLSEKEYRCTTTVRSKIEQKYLVKDGFVYPEESEDFFCYEFKFYTPVHGVDLICNQIKATFFSQSCIIEIRNQQYEEEVFEDFSDIDLMDNIVIESLKESLLPGYTFEEATITTRWFTIKDGKPMLYNVIKLNYSWEEYPEEIFHAEIQTVTWLR